jgi:hypothetical protein
MRKMLCSLLQLLASSAHAQGEPTAGEADDLGRYFLTGGFVFGDYGATDVLPYEPLPPGQEYPALVQILQQGLSTKGLKCDREVSVEKLPSDHAILHCYYDFDAPPMGRGSALSRSGREWRADPWHVLTWEGRTLALLGDQFYIRVCAYCSTGSPPPWNDDPTRALQFGVNTIVFALTQEGSITKRVMDSVE